MTVTPEAPTVSPVAESGVEGTAIALDLGTTVNGLTDDTNSLSSLMVSAIPVGAILSDDQGNTFTAIAGTTSVDVHSWDLSHLTITPADAANFSLSVTATTQDAEGNLSIPVTNTEAVTVTPEAPTVSPVAESGVEGTAIALDLGTTVNGLTDDTNSLSSLMVSAIPVGAILSDDQGNTFTAIAGTTSVDVHSWDLSHLTITPADAANFSLSVTATTQDAEGNLSIPVTNTEAVTVTPEAPTVSPVAESGVEGTAIALDLGTTVNGLTDDTNSLSSLMVSAIPVGAILSDDQGNTFTAIAGTTSVDVHSWDLSHLTIKPADAANFSLSVTATTQDAEGNLSIPVTNTEAVTVTPEAPTVSPVAESGVEGTAIALDLGVAATGLSGDGNTLYSVTVSDIPANATLSDAHGHALTVTGGSITFDASDIAAGILTGLTLTPENAGPVTLNVSAVEQDLNGDLSTAQTGSENITVSPVSNGAQTFTWNNPGGGDWDDAGSWSPSGPPGTTDNVVIDTSTLTDPSNPLTITLSDPTVTVADLTISSGVKLDVEAGSNLVVNGTLQNAGDIDPDQIVPLHLTLNGSLDNTGTIENLTDGLTIDGTMTGDFINSGTIDAATALTISASVAGDFTVTGEKGLIETYDPDSSGVSITINGASIGGDLSIKDGAFVEASADVTIDSAIAGGFSVADSAFIEADNGAITIDGSIDGDFSVATSDSDPGSYAFIEAGTTVTIDSSIGQNFSVTGSAYISSDTADVSIGGSIGGDFSVTAADSGSAAFIEAAGNIFISSAITGNFSLGNGGFLEADGGDVQITGSIGGNFSLDASDPSASYIEASDNVLISAPITGGFSLAEGTFISADGGDLTIGAIGGDFANSGSLEASEGTITFNGLIGGSFTNATDGTIIADQLDIESGVGHAFENDGQVTLGGGGSGTNIYTSTIAVALTNTGTIDVQAVTLSLSGGTVTNGGLLEATSGGTLDVQDSEINNSGTGDKGVLVDGSSFLEVDVAPGTGGTLQLIGGGTLALQSGSQILGNGADAETLENVDNTIIGAGTIGNGDGRLTLHNDAGGTGSTTGSEVFNDDTNGPADITAATLLSGIAGAGSNDLANPITTADTLIVDGTTITFVASDATGNEVNLTDSIATLLAMIDSLTGGSSSVSDGQIELFTSDTGTVSIGGTALAKLGLTPGTTDHIATIAADGDTLTLDTGNTVTNTGMFEATNSGTLAVVDGTTIASGTMTIDSTSVLDVEVGNNGQGGVNGFSFDAALDGVTVTNSGTIDVDQQGTGEAVLDLVDGTTVSGGVLDMENSGEVYVQNGSGPFGATLDGVTVTNNGDGIDIGAPVTTGSTLILDDGTTITGGTLTLEQAADVLDIEVGPHGPGGINGPGPDATLDGVSVTGVDAVTIDSPAPATTIEVGVTTAATLLLDDGTSIANGAMTIGTGSTLDVEVGNIRGGGDAFNADAILDGVIVTNSGTIEIDQQDDGAVLTLDDGTIIHGGALTVGDSGTLDIETGSGGSSNPDATLDGVTVTAADSSSAIQIGGSSSTGVRLLLDGGTVISNGTLTIGSSNTLDIEAGTHGLVHGATLDGVSVTDNGALDIGDVTSGAILTLDDGTTVTGGGTGTLTINSANTLDIEAGANGLVHGATLDGVNVTDHGALDLGDVTSGAFLSLDDGTTVSGGGTGTLTIGSGDTLEIDQGGATLDDVSVSNSGTIQVGSAVTDDPTLTLDGSTSITGGKLTVESGNTLTLNDASIHNTAITLAGSGDTLKLDSSSTIDGTSTISGLSSGDTIDFTGITSIEDPSLSYNSGTGVLTLNYVNNEQAEHQSITLSGAYTQSDFVLVGDQNGGTDVLFQPTASVTVLTSAGLDFQTTPNPLTEMGSGTIQPGGGSTFTVVDSGSTNEFVFDGYNFSYDINTGNVTGGTIASIQEFAADGSPIADFTGLFDAAQWMAGVQQAATQHDFSAINALVANYTFDFVGGSGPDSFGGAGNIENLNGGAGNDVLDPGSASPAGGAHTLTGGDGADTFVYKAGYGAVTITDVDQGNSGSFDASEGDQIVLSGFSGQPNVTYDAVHNITTADFGGGDVLTLLGISPDQIDANNIVQGDSGNGNNGGGGGGSGVTTIGPVTNNVGAVSEDADHFELNGGFEKDSFIGWSVTGTGALVTASAAHDGSFGASIDTSGGAVTLSQDIGSGGSNTLDFWLKNIGGDPNGFDVSWNGSPVTLQAIGTDGAFTEYQATGLSSASGPAPLVFDLHAGSGNWYLDDVAFTSTPGPAVQTDLGEISFTDTDPTETHSATAAAENSGYIGTFSLDPATESNGSGFVQWQFQVNNSALQYLAQGEMLTQSYDVTINGSDPGSAPLTQTVTVTLVGQNDAPVVQPPGVPDPGPIQLPAGTPDGQGGYQPLVSSNNFTFTDPDFTDTHTVTWTYDGIASNLGPLGTVVGEFSATPLGDSTGGNTGLVHWSFTLDSTDLLLLDNAGLLPNIDEVFDVTVNDGHGGTATKQVSIEINGATLPATLRTVSGTSGPVSATTAMSGLYQLQGATITASGANGVSLTSTDTSTSDFLVAQADAATSIAVSGSGHNGVNLTSTFASTAASIVAFNAASSISATGSGSIGINALGNGNVAINDLSNTSVSGVKYGIDATSQNAGGSGNVAINVYSNATISSTSSYGLLAFNGNAGNINVTTSSGDSITSGSAGINAVNEDGSIAQSANSVIDVNNSSTIHSGSNATGTSSPPAGILAGYLGGSTNPTSYPIAGLYGDVFVDNAGDITAAAGDGIRAYNYGTGNVTVDDTAGTIIALFADHVGYNASNGNGYGDGISAQNYGTGDTDVTTAAGVHIESGGSGIAANNGDTATSSGSLVSVVAYGTIESGINNVLTSSGKPSAGILAGYNPSDLAEANVHGNVIIDDHASITADAGDGIRGYNYGTGNVTITVESDASINGLRYGVGAFTYDGGNISVTNYGSITGGTDAIDVNVTGGGGPAPDGTATIDNHGHLIGDVTGYNATFTNELLGDWSMNGTSAFTGASTLANAGTIESNGTSVVSGLASISNTGTIEVQSGSLDLSGTISGTGTLKIDAGATLELATGASSDQNVTFNATTGMLKLDAAQDFHGVVSNFGSLDGTQTNSDQIDLANINHLSASFNETFDSGSDTLTVTDGTNTAIIQFTGSVGSLNFVDDGNLINGVSGTSGTIVYDPPAPGGQVGPVIAHDPGPAVGGVIMSDPGPPASQVVATAPNQTLTGTGASNSFVFNFANIGHDTVTDFHPGTDTLQFGGAIFANAQAALNATQDDGHGNTVINLDAHDAITLSGVIKAQLHVADFHF